MGLSARQSGDHHSALQLDLRARQSAAEMAPDLEEPQLLGSNQDNQQTIAD